MKSQGWTAHDLPLVGDDPKLWTVAQAAALLGPPHRTVAEVRALVRLRRIQPVGKRRTVAAGRPGRCARVYAAIDLIEAYEKLS